MTYKIAYDKYLIDTTNKLKILLLFTTMNYLFVVFFKVLHHRPNKLDLEAMLYFTYIFINIIGFIKREPCYLDVSRYPGGPDTVAHRSSIDPQRFPP